MNAYATLMNALRATGRTQRMLAKALEHHRAGYNVCVVGANLVHCNELVHHIKKIAGGVNPGVAVVTMGHLPHDPQQMMALGDGASPYAKYFIDHYAIEQHYRRILDELHRYDYGN